MTDRLMLLQALEPRVSLKATESRKFNLLVEKTLKPLMKATPLDVARSLSSRDRAEFIDVIQTAMTVVELKALSKLWLPKRKWPKDSTGTDISAFLVSHLTS
ncbi:MAG: hypothetical protein FD160_2919 [Caulobacteraceae bacterium]|nr:MAG: hypothetical protein FD160_2919 [Caulobacteraceae bacterium]